MNIRAIILDDDPNSHKAACSALAEFPEVEVVGRFVSERELNVFLESSSADVLFLDIEIGEEFGFSVARRLRKTHPKLMIVFLTGHSSYAIDGYDFQPVNFLTKPINPVKLAQTVEEIKKRMKRNTEQRRAQLMFRLLQGYRVIDVRDILFIERSDRKNFLYTESEKLQITGYTMRELDEMLSEYGFFLCHQSFIVNLYRVEKLRDAGRQVYEAEVRGTKAVVPVSRNRYDKLKKELSELGIIEM